MIDFICIYDDNKNFNLLEYVNYCKKIIKQVDNKN